MLYVYSSLYVYEEFDNITLNFWDIYFLFLTLQNEGVLLAKEKITRFKSFNTFTLHQHNAANKVFRPRAERKLQYLREGHDQATLPIIFSTELGWTGQGIRPQWRGEYTTASYIFKSGRTRHWHHDHRSSQVIDSCTQVDCSSKSRRFHI